MAYRDVEHERLEAEVFRLRAALEAVERMSEPVKGRHQCWSLVEIRRHVRETLALGVE